MDDQSNLDPVPTHAALETHVRLALSEILQQDLVDALEAFLSLSHHPLRPGFDLRSALTNSRISSSETLDPKIASAFESVLEAIVPLLGIKGTDIDVLPSRVRLAHDLIEIYGSVGGDRASVLPLQTRCGLIYRLGCWCSIGNVKDEWELDGCTRKLLTDSIDRLWPGSECIYEAEARHEQLPPVAPVIKLASFILSNHIRPLFGSVTSNVNTSTGRRVERKHAQLFGPAASVGDEDLDLWKRDGCGFYNVISLLVARLKKPPEFEAIWPLLVPPTVTLLEQSIPIHRLRGLQLSRALLQHAPPILICRTGIDSLFQKALSISFTFLHLPETLDILGSAFEAQAALIECQWAASDRSRTAQADRYTRLNKFLEDCLFNLLAFSKTDREDRVVINLFILTHLHRFVDLLGLALARHYRVIMPYLCDLISNVSMNSANAEAMRSALALVVRLMETGEDLAAKWRSRLLVVVAVGWVELRKPLTVAGSDALAGNQVAVESIRAEFSSTMKYLRAIAAKDRSGVRAKVANKERVEKLVEKISRLEPLLKEILD